MNLVWAMFDSVTQNMSALLAYLQDTILETNIVKKKKKKLLLIRVTQQKDEGILFNIGTLLPPAGHLQKLHMPHKVKTLQP